MTNKAVTEQELQARNTGKRVTQAEVDLVMARVQYVEVVMPGNTTSTFVHAFLDGKFFLDTGFSACVDPTQFKADIGSRLAKENAQKKATSKVWELLGYELYEKMQAEANSTFHTRLTDEFNDLLHRHDKLNAFLGKGKPEGFDEDHWVDLMDQSSIQAELLLVLKRRLERLSKKQ